MMRSMHADRRLLVILASVALVVAACSSSPKGSPSASPTTLGTDTSTTLRVAFLDDIGPPDPDIFYGSEGLMVTNSVYEGLLQYANNSTKIIPSLSALPTVSADGMTYTFKLQPGVTFHDGTPFNSAAVAFSFARRTKIDQGPAYMLAHVKTVDTPDPLTVIVQLNQPVSAFLDYLASPFGPKMVSPTEITAHSAGNDEGQKWLQTHDAGTGPFEITSFVPNQKYVLNSYSAYWGPKPAFNEVDISIESDISTQELELENGQLDMIMHGLTPSAIASFAGKAGFAVHTYPTELKALLFVNPHKGPFVSEASRDTLEELFNKAAMTKSVFGSAGVASTQIYPAGELPADLTTSVVPYDPAALAKLVPTLPTKTVDVGYDPTDPRNATLAELVQLDLENAGMSATTRAIPIAQIFDLANDPSAAPDILIQTTNPDAAHPDTWARIYMSMGGGGNYLNFDDPAVDALLDAGLAATTPQAVDQDYGQAGNLLVTDGEYIDIADVNDAIVTRNTLTGFYHIPSMPWYYNLDTLRNA